MFNYGLEPNLISDTDSYKFSHPYQYPPRTSRLNAYLEPRIGSLYHENMMAGNNILVNKLARGVTKSNVEEMAEFAKLHGEPFPLEGWMHIVNKHGGRLPIEVRAVPEGMVVPISNVLLTTESTDPEVFWISSWLEDQFVRMWYPITVATRSMMMRRIIMANLLKTADDPENEIWFKVHDFGNRGVSSEESAMIGGCVHLFNFKGSDTVPGIRLANKLYKPNGGMAGFSIAASEHSSMTTWVNSGGETAAMRNMIQKFKDRGVFACVSDSYDIDHAVENIWGGELRQEVIDSGALLIVRPDSGNIVEGGLRVLNKLADKFGYTYNSKGYRVLKHTRMIWGDGVEEETARQLYGAAEAQGFSGTNIAVGMGGALLQKLDRDTQKFAYKCSAAVVDGQEIEVFKDPVTDKGKRSKRGPQDLINRLGKFETIKGKNTPGSLLRPIFRNGEILIEEQLDQIRERAWG